MKTTVNFATYNHPKRREAIKKAVDHVIDQVDQVNIHWNNYFKFEIPEWAINNPKIVCTNGPDLSDNGKFYHLSQITEPEYYFTLDDKILVPKNYITNTKREIDRKGCIVAYHGRKLTTDQRYYSGHHLVLKWGQDQNKDIEIDVPGTGLMGFRTDYFKSDTLYGSEHKKVSDLLFAIEAKQKGKKIICLKHSRSWIKALNLKGIWHEYHKKPEPLQRELLGKIQNF